jgi:hypothetical protein
MTSKTRGSRKEGEPVMSVRALRRLSKAEALNQFLQRPATNISEAARQWGCSRSTARQWIAEFTAPPPGDGSAAVDAAMETHPADMAPPLSAVEAFKIVLCDLADLIETTTPQEILDSANAVELLGLTRIASWWPPTSERSRPWRARPSGGFDDGCCDTTTGPRHDARRARGSSRCDARRDRGG